MGGGGKVLRMICCHCRRRCCRWCRHCCSRCRRSHRCRCCCHCWRCCCRTRLLPPCSIVGAPATAVVGCRCTYARPLACWPPCSIAATSAATLAAAAAALACCPLVRSPPLALLHPPVLPLRLPLRVHTRCRWPLVCVHLPCARPVFCQLYKYL
jgi:hypothetical protein